MSKFTTSPLEKNQLEEFPIPSRTIFLQSDDKGIEFGRRTFYSRRAIRTIFTRLHDVDRSFKWGGEIYPVATLSSKSKSLPDRFFSSTDPDFWTSFFRCPSFITHWISCMYSLFSRHWFVYNWFLWRQRQVVSTRWLNCLLRFISSSSSSSSSAQNPVRSAIKIHRIILSIAIAAISSTVPTKVMKSRRWMSVQRHFYDLAGKFQVARFFALAGPILLFSVSVVMEDNFFVSDDDPKPAHPAIFCVLVAKPTSYVLDKRNKRLKSFRIFFFPSVWRRRESNKFAKCRKKPSKKSPSASLWSLVR